MKNFLRNYVFVNKSSNLLTFFTGIILWFFPQIDLKQKILLSIVCLGLILLLATRCYIHDLVNTISCLKAENSELQAKIASTNIQLEKVTTNRDFLSSLLEKKSITIESYEKLIDDIGQLHFYFLSNPSVEEKKHIITLSSYISERTLKLKEHDSNE